MGPSALGAIVSLVDGSITAVDGPFTGLRSAAPPRPSALVTQHRDEIRRLVAHHRGSDARIIGSVARGTDRSGSDLDLVVRFSDDASLYDLVELREDLHDLLGGRRRAVGTGDGGGRPVDQGQCSAVRVPL